MHQRLGLSQTVVTCTVLVKNYLKKKLILMFSRIKWEIWLLMRKRNLLYERNIIIACQIYS